MYNIGCLHTVFGRVWRGVIDTKCFLAENTGFDEMGNLHKSSLGLIFRALLGVSVKSCSEAAGQIMLRSCWLLRPRPPPPTPGYRATPTFCMCFVYLLYWMTITSIAMWRYHKVSNARLSRILPSAMLA